jgi:hypothetical protein
MNSRRRIGHPSSRFIGSLSRPRMHGNGAVADLVIEKGGCLLRCMSPWHSFDFAAFFPNQGLKRT